MKKLHARTALGLILAATTLILSACGTSTPVATPAPVASSSPAAAAASIGPNAGALDRALALLATAQEYADTASAGVVGYPEIAKAVTGHGVDFRDGTITIDVDGETQQACIRPTRAYAGPCTD